MSKLIDLTGQKFGRLTVIERHTSSKRSGVHWLCKCDCGNYIVAASNNLKSGHTKSCGCLSKEMSHNRSKKYNHYDLSGEYGVGYTSKGEEFYFDLEDYDKIKDHCWYVDSHTGYVRTRISKHKQISMHRLLLPDAEEIDHKINNSKNDNRRSNLRACTHQNNMMNIGLRKNNTTGVTGVYWLKNRNKWRAEITYKNNVIGLGNFDNFEDAVIARKNAEEKYYGNWSYDNSMNLGGSENTTVTDKDICDNSKQDDDLSWLNELV